MNSMIDNLLRRLAHPTIHTSPCRVCSSESDTGDICSKCIMDEVRLLSDDKTYERVFEMLLDIGKLNRQLDYIEGQMSVIKEENGL